LNVIVIVSDEVYVKVVVVCAKMDISTFS